MDIQSSSPPPGARSGRSARRRWYLAGHSIVGAWLAAGLVVSLGHPFVPESRWLLVHLLLLGAAGTAILVWSEHFALALLHRPAADVGRGGAWRLGAFTAGVVGVAAGVVGHTWPVVLAGGSAVAAAAAGHAVALARLARGALPGRFAFVVRYYVAAASLLPVGAGLGVVLARHELDGDQEARVRAAHEALNLWGWVGLTVLGTLVTLWPTMLRTKLSPGAERAARRALPVLLAGVVLMAGAALVAPPAAAVLGLGCYAAGVAMSARPLVDAARRRPPSGMPTWSVAAGCGWLVASLAVLAAVLVVTPDWTGVGERLAVLTPMLAVGWVAQTLLGALAYLVPVLIGGGPRAVRTMVAVLDRGATARVTAANAALAVAVLPVPGAVRVLCAALVLAVLTGHVWLLVRAALAGRAARTGPASPGPASGPEPSGPEPSGPASPGSRAPAARAGAGPATGLAVVALAVAVGGSLAAGGPWAPGGSSAVTVEPTGHTTTVTIEALDMRFSPARIEVPAGDRLVVVVRNTDDDRHDLVLGNGRRTPRIPAGGTRTLDAGVIGEDLDGWCSVLGHRQAGMVLAVRTTGSEGSAARPGAGAEAGTGTGNEAGHGAGHEAGAGAAAGAGTPAFDPMATPGAGFAARDAVLEPLPPGTGPRLHRRTVTVREVEREVAPGVRQQAWTFDGTVPGPALHGRIGDTFEITLVNGGSIGHSIDFHAGSLAPGAVMRTIQPGESLLYRFTATRSGIWMYHCSTMPMSLHIANGMFGAVVIDPPGLAPVAHEYVLVQSEEYFGAPGGIADQAKLRAVTPDAVVFNGYPDQYVARPLTASVGDRVRFWVLAAGPGLGTSFHVVGGQFDTVFEEGAFRLTPADPAGGGAQVLGLAPAAGGFAELTFPEAGSYPFVSHRMVDAERGARGTVTVSP